MQLADWRGLGKRKQKGWDPKKAHRQSTPAGIVLAGTGFPDCDALIEAHALACYRGNAYRAPEAAPPTEDPYNCKLSELEKTVRGDEPVAPDAAWVKPIRELAAELRGETTEAPAPEYSMTAADLRTQLETPDAEA